MKNSADYAYIGGKLYIKQSWVDPDHFCPAVLELKHLQLHETEVYEFLKSFPKATKFVSAVVNVKAWKKGEFQFARNKEATTSKKTPKKGGKTGGKKGS